MTVFTEAVTFLCVYIPSKHPQQSFCLQAKFTMGTFSFPVLCLQPRSQSSAFNLVPSPLPSTSFPVLCLQPRSQSSAFNLVPSPLPLTSFPSSAFNLIPSSLPLIISSSPSLPIAAVFDCLHFYFLKVVVYTWYGKSQLLTVWNVVVILFNEVGNLSNQNNV